MPDGIAFVCKSFFELDGQLKGYELVILKHVLHDWSDKDSLAIQNSCGIDRIRGRT